MTMNGHADYAEMNGVAHAHGHSNGVDAVSSSPEWRDKIADREDFLTKLFHIMLKEAITDGTDVNK